MKKHAAVGLMSGTSMDGVDAALIETDGLYHIREIDFTSLRYDEPFQILLKSAEYAVYKSQGNLDLAKMNFAHYLNQFLEEALKIENLDAYIKMLKKYLNNDDTHPITLQKIIEKSTRIHAIAVERLLNKLKWSYSDIDVIGYHGQALFHAPADKITIQVGHPEYLANLFNAKVVSHFRIEDIELGGQGAPLAPIYHFALVKRDNLIPAVVVNCGGIANLTLIQGEQPEYILGYDAGPGNCLIDRIVRQRTQGKMQMDTNGRFARNGKIQPVLLEDLLLNSCIQNGINYFQQKPPKSLDVNALKLSAAFEHHTLEDICATLAAFTAQMIVHSLDWIKGPIPKHWILTGGGWKNPNIKKNLEWFLETQFPGKIITRRTDEVGWNSQALEAQLFAYLAVRRLQQLPTSFPNTTQVARPLSGGKIITPTQIPS